MATVTGSIGNEHVELNNAATEATLFALLSVEKGNSAVLRTLAAKSGIDEKSIAAVSAAATNTATGLNKVTSSTNAIDIAHQKYKETQDKATASFNTVKQSVDQLGAQLIAGTAKTSDVFAQLSRLPGIAGILFEGFRRVASFQEQNLETYRKISSAGINFSGSLMDMRLAATNSYLTLDQFSNLMKNNSDVFVRLGGTANEGGVAFNKFSAGLLHSNIGKQLLYMGWTAESANQSMATYIGSMGAKDAKELATSKILQAGTAGYLDQLDRLAQITGKTREQQDEALKKTMLEADINLTASRMSKEDRDVFLKNIQFMTTMYGDAGKDMALAQAQHREVSTKAGGLLTSLAPGMRSAMQTMEQVGKQYGTSSKEYIDAQNQMRLAAQEGIGRLDPIVVSVNDAFKGLDTAISTVSNEVTAGQTTKAELDKIEAKREENKAKIAISNAKTATEAELALKDLGNSITTWLSPTIIWMTDHLKELGAATVVLTGAFYAARLASIIKNLGIGELGSSPLRPMHVTSTGLPDIAKAAAAGSTAMMAATLSTVAVGGVAATMGATGLLAAQPELRKALTQSTPSSSMLGAMGGDTSFASAIMDANESASTAPSPASAPGKVAPTASAASDESAASLKSIEKSNAAMLQHTKESNEYTKRLIDAIKSLGGNLFP